MKPRLTTLLTAGFLTLGTGETLALAGGNGDSSNHPSASFNQYRTECPAGLVLVGASECHNPNEQPATTASTSPPNATPPSPAATETGLSSPPSKASHHHEASKTGAGAKKHRGRRAGKRKDTRNDSHSHKRRRKATHNK